LFGQRFWGKHRRIEIVELSVAESLRARFPEPSTRDGHSRASEFEVLRRGLTQWDFRRDVMANGLYRTISRKPGQHYAFVDYGTASDIGEIPRDLYERRGYLPKFDSLPTKAEFDAANGKEATLFQVA
jgi:hypothetical protein